MSCATPLSTKTSTRILTLLPSTNDEPISVTLEVVDLVQEYPEYEAISYTWGSSATEHTTLADGHGIHVKTNLSQCLQRLRSSKPRRLWCDYLCITQTDHREKAQQFRIIGTILAAATTVLIWLGEHANGSENLLHDWDEHCRPLRYWPQRSPEYQEWEAAYKAAALEREWQWVYFWQRAYWRRNWIIQELKLAQRIIVHVGFDAMDWKELITARFTSMGMYGAFDRLPSRSTLHQKSDLDDPLLVLASHMSWQSRIVHVPVTAMYPVISERLNPQIPFWYEELHKPARELRPPHRWSNGPARRLTARRFEELNRSGRTVTSRMDRRDNDTTAVSV